jgi:hypothetical protein
MANDLLTDEQKKYLESGIVLEDFDEEYQGGVDGKVEWMNVKVFLMEAIKQDVRILKHASAEMRADRELAIETIKIDINALRYFDDEICDLEMRNFIIIMFFKGEKNIEITDEDLHEFVVDAEFVRSPSESIEKLLHKVTYLLLNKKKEEFENFTKDIITLVNKHHECFWILRAIQNNIENTMGLASYWSNDESICEFCENSESLWWDVLDNKLDFIPELEFETYFRGREWWGADDEKGLPFTEFIMSKTDMMWDTESWSDVKFYNHAISRLFIALQNFTVLTAYGGYDPEEIAKLFYEVIPEKYDPIQNSGSGYYGSYVFETVVEYLIEISKNDYNLDETDRNDLEEYDGWRYDLKKVGELMNFDMFDYWPGASEFAKKKKKK